MIVVGGIMIGWGIADYLLGKFTGFSLVIIVIGAIVSICGVISEYSSRE